MSRTTASRRSTPRWLRVRPRLGRGLLGAGLLTVALTLAAMSVRALPAPADDSSAHRPAVTSRPALPAAAPPADPVRPTPRRPRSRVIAAAGDIACDPASRSFHGGRGTANACHMRATARLLGKLHPVVVLTLGDNQYENGTLAKFRRFYDPSWGGSRAAPGPLHPGLLAQAPVQLGHARQRRHLHRLLARALSGGRGRGAGRPRP